jgi:uncharacterized membrane protein YeaQ/YmgE (transglycosylase-associated protein family)
MLHIIWSIIVGAIVGWIAELTLGARLGFWKCALLGIAGSIIGGLIARLFSKPEPGSAFHPAGFIMSIGPFAAAVLSSSQRDLRKRLLRLQ